MAADSIQIPGYEILRPLGSGGMSTVYLALQRSLDRKVAIKVMRRNFDGGEDGQIEKRFLLEGRMLAKLPHRNIVSVYDIVSNDNIAYIAMEYLGGGVLSERMRRGLSLADAVSVIVQIASALEFAHERGVVHRDLKPANIMFRDTGTPALTDFGIARYQDGSAVRLTQTGMLVGTPTYMSPEQINGAPVDGRADQYSLGVLFYELLTGAPPFQADTSIAVLMAHLQQPLPELPYEFRAFDDVIARMLAKNREERYSNLKDFSDDLRSRLVSSDTLLMRLQVDPEQPSSEQLRALGFSTSTPGVGLTREGSAVRIVTPRPARAPPASVPSADNAQGAPRKHAVPILAAALAVLIAASVAGWALWNRHGELSGEERELIALRLDRAERRIESNQLFSTDKPDDEGAYAYLQKVLQRDPDNARAKQLLGQLMAVLTKQADAAFAGGNVEGASALVEQGLRVQPADSALLALKARIEQTRVAPVAAATNAETQGTSAAIPTATAPPQADVGAASAAAATSLVPESPVGATVERGELLFNAQPWATVESVVDEQHKAIALPADVNTPLTLALPVGKYVVTFRNPYSTKPVEVAATVEANKRSQAVAVFATTSVTGYFSRVGW